MCPPKKAFTEMAKNQPDTIKTERLISPVRMPYPIPDGKKKRSKGMRFPFCAGRTDADGNGAFSRHSWEVEILKHRNRKWLIAAGIAVMLLMAGFTGVKTVLNGQTVYKRGEAAIFYVRALDEAGELKASGSGFCVNESGLALTAAHVIKGANAVHAVLPDGRELTAGVVSRDDKTDIAVLRLPAQDTAYAYLTLETKTPESGERVYAIGYPLKTTKIVSDGVVSAPNADINGTQRLLISAELASGMSGGPVLCEHGYVVGLNAATLRTMNGVSTSPTTMQLLDAVRDAQKPASTKK